MSKTENPVEKLDRICGFESAKLECQSPFNLLGKPSKAANQIKMSFLELGEDASRQDKENKERANRANLQRVTIGRSRRHSKVHNLGRSSRLTADKRSQRASKKRSIVCVLNPRKSSTMSSNSPLRNKKFRHVRRCVFERPNLKNLRGGRQNIITSKKNTLKLLEEGLKGPLEEYNTVYNNILVENLIRNYPNYLKDFRKRVDEDHPR